jgi:hypothetical protein
MALVMCMLFGLACSLALSIVAFLIGRCGRRLPIDDMLPRAVHSARWGPDEGY